MSIASAITAAQGRVADCYTAISNKGGTLPATQNLSNMPAAIESIPSGGGSAVITSLNVTPTTSAQTITAPSGTDGYNPVNVSAVTSSIDSNITASNIKKDVTILGVTGTYEGSGGTGIPREVKNGVYQIPTESFSFSLPSDATQIGSNGLSYAFYQCTGLTSLSFPELKIVESSGAAYAFYHCTGLTSLSFPELTTIRSSGFVQAFQRCASLTSLPFPKLTTIESNGLRQSFYQCTGLTNISFPKLTTIGSNGLYAAFQGCTNITDFYFNALTTSTFSSIQNQFVNMMSSTGSTTTHTLHFPGNMESTIQSLTGYPLFGGTSGYVILAFDLPATT